MAKSNIVLIGFMGTGKSSVGKILAQKLKRHVIDLDREIEKKEKRTIGEIFETHGEVYFRGIEKQMVKEASRTESAVIVTGGGVPLDEENMAALRESGWIVALRAPVETIVDRVKGSRHRPLLKGGDLPLEVAKLLEKRKPHYENADFGFDTAGRTPAEVADQILRGLEGKIAL